VRIAPLAMMAAAGGIFYQTLGLWGSGVAAGTLGSLYIWVMRPFYDSLPIDPKVQGWLVRLHLLRRASHGSTAAEPL
jgi:hypothetical protein